jgi:glycosyltransferase involved in cell wall biosynthesis
MLSRDLGGIQQAFLDYSTALKSQGIEVVNVTSIFAKINHIAVCKEQNTIKLPNLGPWDFISSLYLRLIIKLMNPDIIIAHGNRAINFVKGHLFQCSSPPLIGVAHNYSIKGLKKCDYVIALTKHMEKHLIQQNFNSSNIFIIPNMLAVKEDFVARDYQDPVVIGTLARFVKKKGIDILLRSFKILKDQGYIFKAIIGGNGEERNNLINLSKTLGLNSEILFVGWVQDKDRFFTDIDIFCLPSLHEPFGIIILEAMGRSLPIVATNTEGPQEILRDRQDGLLCDISSSSDLAEKLAYLIDNQKQACEFTKSAYLRLKENYAINVVALKLVELIKRIDIAKCL